MSLRSLQCATKNQLGVSLSTSHVFNLDTNLSKYYQAQKNHSADLSSVQSMTLVTTKDWLDDDGGGCWSVCLCFVFKCCLRCRRNLKRSKHRWHPNGRISWWTVFLCNAKTDDFVNDFSHWSHSYGLSPVCECFFI